MVSSVMDFQDSHYTDEDTEDRTGKAFWTELEFKFGSFTLSPHHSYNVHFLHTQQIRSGNSELLRFFTSLIQHLFD